MIKVDYGKEIIELKLAGSNAMNVNGSVESKVFKFQPGAGERYELQGICLFILDPGDMTHNVFGSLLNSLADGLDFTVKKKVETKLRNIRDNTDILMTFGQQVMTGDSGTAFLNERDYFKGSFLWEQDEYPILDGDFGDLVKCSVGDDLRDILSLRVSVLLRKII